MQNTAKFHTFLAFWLALVSADATNVSANSKAKQAQNKITIYSLEKIVRKNLGVTPGGIIHLLDATTKKVAGVSDWNGDSTDSLQNLLFDRLKFGYATHADADKEGELDYSTKIPAVLLNANLVIRQNNREVFRRPISAINNNHVGTNLEDDYCDLGEIKYVSDNNTVEMFIELPKGISLAGTDNHYVFVALNGFATKEK